MLPDFDIISNCKLYFLSLCNYRNCLIFFLVVPVRLSDGHSNRSGRVEMYINGVWGTVCDDHWNISSSTVVCRQLGLGNTGTFSRYGAGLTGSPIHLDDVKCSGNEDNILACSHLQLSVHNCDHSEDVGVTCSGLYS